MADFELYKMPRRIGQWLPLPTLSDDSYAKQFQFYASRRKNNSKKVQEKNIQSAVIWCSLGV
jgi:hypothetical protein